MGHASTRRLPRENGSIPRAPGDTSEFLAYDELRARVDADRLTAREQFDPRLTRTERDDLADAERYAVFRWMLRRNHSPFCRRPSEKISTGPNRPSGRTIPRPRRRRSTSRSSRSRWSAPRARRSPVTSGAPKIERSQSCVVASHWYDVAKPEPKLTVNEPTGAPTGGAFWAT